MIEFLADRNEGGQRLDRLLRKRYPDLPLSRIFGLLRQKRVKLNGKHAQGNARVEEGDRLQIFVPADLAELFGEGTTSPAAASPKADAPKREVPQGGYRIVAQEPGEWMLLDKESGVPSQPGSGIPEGESLVERLWAASGSDWGGFRPALAHRLDRDTSGLVMAALSAPTLRHFAELIRERKTDKRYYALVAGRMERESGTIRLALERVSSARGGAKNVAGSANGVEAVTRWKLEKQFAECALLSVELGTGRMHQIRAHLAAVGHPLLGDDRYGDFALNRRFRKEFGLRRLFLHARHLAFPGYGSWDSPLPPELKAVLGALERGG